MFSIHTHYQNAAAEKLLTENVIQACNYNSLNIAHIHTIQYIMNRHLVKKWVKHAIIRQQTPTNLVKRKHRKYHIRFVESKYFNIILPIVFWWWWMMIRQNFSLKNGICLFAFINDSSD